MLTCNSLKYLKNNVSIFQKKVQNKRKNTASISKNEVPNKKVKLSYGFIVENCDSITPSLTNEVIKATSNKKNKNKAQEPEIKKPAKTTRSAENVKRNKNKARLGECTEENNSNLTPEDMLTWSEFKLPEPILKALAELGFKQPTNIQQLTLPSAIHGKGSLYL